MAEHFKELFYPESVAIVGASEEAESVGLGICANLKSYSKPVYFVNPNHATILGKPSYASLAAIHEHIDLVIIAVKSTAVPSVVEEAGNVGVKAAIIISAGFKESSPDGAKLEETVKRLCNSYDITMIGPNCLGVINPAIYLNASFAASMPPAGSIAFISQSGALCTSVIDYAKDLAVGFSKFVSTGNKACVSEIALMQYLAADADTKAIFLYVEDILDAAGFIETAYKITHGPNPKPIVILKGGRTEAGAKASVSHTGALGGNDLYYHALARQGGIIRAHSIAEMFNLALVIAHNPFPAGNRVAVITNAGGPGILMTDEAVTSGLTMATLSPETLAELSAIIPSYSHVGNPVDLLGDAKADRYQRALAAVEKDTAVDSTLLLLTPQSGTEIVETAKVIAGTLRDKPKAVSFMGKDVVVPGIDILRKGGLAVTEYPEDAARALAQFTNFSLETKKKSEDFTLTDIDEMKASSILSGYSSHALIPEREAGMLLSAYGFPVLRSIAARSAEETIAAVKSIGKPCAVKISSPDITHKTDVGGVKLNVTAETAASSYDAIISSVHAKVPDAKISGVTVVEMAPSGGTECILGLIRKPNFGAVVMVGMGGTFVEVTKDISFGIAPLLKSDAVRMISELKFAPVLAGFRGMPPFDTDVLVDCIGKLALLAIKCQTITELDINPILLYPKGQGAKIVDVRILVH